MTTQPGVDSSTIEWVAPSALAAWAKNPNTHPSEQIRQLSAAIERFGFLAPVVVFADASQNLEVRAGHGRLEAMRLLLKKDPAFRPRNAPQGAPAGAVPILRLPVASRAEADAFGLSDTAISRLGKLDEDIAAQLLRELQAEGVGIGSIGFDDQLDTLLGELVEETAGPTGFHPTGKAAAARKNVTVELSILVPLQWDLVEQAIRQFRVEKPDATVGEAIVGMARSYLRGA